MGEKLRKSHIEDEIEMKIEKLGFLSKENRLFWRENESLIRES